MSKTPDHFDRKDGTRGIYGIDLAGLVRDANEPDHPVRHVGTPGKPWPETGRLT